MFYSSLTLFFISSSLVLQIFKTVSNFLDAPESFINDGTLKSKLLKRNSASVSHGHRKSYIETRLRNKGTDAIGFLWIPSSLPCTTCTNYTLCFRGSGLCILYLQLHGVNRAHPLISPPSEILCLSPRASYLYCLSQRQWLRERIRARERKIGWVHGRTQQLHQHYTVDMGWLWIYSQSKEGFIRWIREGMLPRRNIHSTFSNPPPTSVDFLFQVFWITLFCLSPSPVLSNNAVHTKVWFHKRNEDKYTINNHLFSSFSCHSDKMPDRTT